MPTYDYRCKQCGTFEYVQSMKDRALTACPTCGKPVQRLISNSVGIIFKGPGFYVTDNGRKTERSGATASENGSNTNDKAGKEESSSDTSAKNTSDTGSDSSKKDSKKDSKEKVS